MEIWDGDSWSGQAARVSGLLQRGKSEIEEVKSSQSASQAVSSLPQCQLVKDLTAVFNIFDKNGDGKISKVELGSTLRSLGENLTEAELDRMVKEVDADGDGHINLQEFIYLNTVTLESTSAGESHLLDSMKDAFQVFDLDKNGFISADELYKVLTRLGDENLTLEECRYMIKSVDKDGDEMVDLMEFQQMMSSSFAH